jgi:hypothetical protein
VAGVTWGLAPEALADERPDRRIDDARELLDLVSK